MKCSANILINEIMYDPEPNDNYNEWIELYNPTNQTINISGWSITDNSAQDYLEGDFENGNGTTIIPAFSYVIIADHGTKIYENFSIPNNTVRLYVDDTSIGNGLGNSGDKLILKNKTGTITDAVEWIINYDDVPGLPALPVLENHSISRYSNVDTDNCSSDFYESTNPTPGTENKIELKPCFKIDLCPEFVPKIKNNSFYSLPFAFKLNISNYPANTSYQLKSYIVGNLSDSLPSTQTWNGTDWQYSTYYTSTIVTDSYGNWSGWQYLRFKKDYKEYEDNIKNNYSAYLKAKIKKDNFSEEIHKSLFLLDTDYSTSNGTSGGYTTGIIADNNTFLEGKTAIIENESGNITGIYLTENNGIDDELISKPGYFKLASPLGSNYILKFLENDCSVIKTFKNITIKQGIYGVDISSNQTNYFIRKNETMNIPLIVKNTGDFNDTIDLNISQLTLGWNASLEKENVYLDSKQTSKVDLSIILDKDGLLNGNVTISARSRNDSGEFKQITLNFEILAPDLTIKNIKIYNEQDYETNSFGEGEIIKIKAFLKNLGNENATNVDIKFYYNYLDKQYFIDNISYDSVGKYQKYPTVDWDTKDAKPSKYIIVVTVDEVNYLDELDENNNKLSVEINIFKTNNVKMKREIIISEIYYHTHPAINNEYITIYNPNSESVDISGWYITNDPLELKTKQTKIIFPDNIIISSNSCLYITQNASAYTWETGKKPDYEFEVDSSNEIPQMQSYKKFTLSNKGDVVALKDLYNHTIDVVVYGNISYNFSGWNGTSIPSSGQGVILKRNFDENYIPIDTNTSSDWNHPRRYGIGQSDFPYVKINFNGEITTFVSPDNSFETISNELRNAKESICLNIYEFTDPFLCNELILALHRGVMVKIFLEGCPIGNLADEEKYVLNRIANYGGKIRFIANNNENKVFARYIFDHGKYLIIDNETVIVESCNWAKTGIPKDPTYGNREWGLIVRSKDIANYFMNVFLDDWNPERCDSFSYDKVNLSIQSDFYMDQNVYTGLYKPQFKSESFIGNFSAIPVFSPDTSYKAICDMIDSANNSIYIEQLYIYKDWNNRISPFVERLVNKSKQGVEIKVILNYNPYYDSTNEKNNATKEYLEERGIEVKYIFSNWSYFTNIHNKGMIVDNKSVLISSVNWNENSVIYNREAGIIIENEDVAKYYADVFFYDWNLSSPNVQKQEKGSSSTDNSNTIYIVVIFTMTFTFIAHDWRKRKWT